MSKKHAGITREHMVALEEILSWAKINPAVSAFEVDVIEELIPKLTAHAKNGAIVRVREKNMGARPAIHTPGERAWSEEELDLFRDFYRRNISFEEISEQVSDRFHSERSYQACQSLARRLGLRRPYIRAKGTARPERSRMIPVESNDTAIELLWKRDNSIEQIAMSLSLTAAYVDERVQALGLLLEITPSMNVVAAPRRERSNLSAIRSIMEERRRREGRARREEVYA